MYKLEVNLPNRDKGSVVNIVGLGTFVNGESYDISEEDAERFMRLGSHLVRRGRKGHTYSTAAGPNLADAFKSFDGITVTDQKEEQSPKGPVVNKTTGTGGTANEGKK